MFCSAFSLVAFCSVGFLFRSVQTPSTRMRSCANPAGHVLYLRSTPYSACLLDNCTRRALRNEYITTCQQKYIQVPCLSNSKTRLTHKVQEKKTDKHPLQAEWVLVKTFPSLPLLIRSRSRSSCPGRAGRVFSPTVIQLHLMCRT